MRLHNGQRLISGSEELTSTIAVPGQIKGAGGVTASAALLISYPEYFSDRITIHAVLMDHPDLEFLMPGSVGPLEISGRLPSGETLRITRAWLKEARPVEAIFDCEEFIFGTETPPPYDRGTVNITVRTPPAAPIHIASVNAHSGLGGIESTAAWDDAIKWTSSMGEFVIAQCYHSKSILGPCGAMGAQIPVGEFHLETEIDGGISPAELANRVSEIVHDPIWLFSFLARRSLAWYEVQLVYTPSGPSGGPLQSLLRRRRIRCMPQSDYEPILLQHQLRKGGFQTLMDAFTNSPAKNWLLRAMISSVASYEESSLEGSLAMTYLASEAVANGFAKMRKSTCPSTATTGEKSLWKKLQALVDQKELKIVDLWPPGTPWVDGLQNAAQTARDAFIHEARIDDNLACFKDMVRLRVIVERALLKLLNWPDNNIHSLAFETQWLRQ